MKFTVEKAEEFLFIAGVFYDNELNERGNYELNQNDVWGWACAMGEDVKESELPELAELFWRYGDCGILYWVSKKNEGMRSEFYDNNRFIEFVENEEYIRRIVPDSNHRAYVKYRYEIRGDRGGKFRRPDIIKTKFEIDQEASQKKNNSKKKSLFRRILEFGFWKK